MNTHPLDTIVAGVRCRDVLADLSDFLDGTLAAPRVETLQQHLAGCDNCTRFGGQVAHTLQLLRAHTPPSPRDVIPVVLAKLRAEG